MKVKLLEAVFGFEKGVEYSANESECGSGYIVMNGAFKRFVLKLHAEVVQ